MKFLGPLATILCVALALPLTIPGDLYSHVNRLEARMPPFEGNRFTNVDLNAGYANRLMEAQEKGLPPAYNAETEHRPEKLPTYQEHTQDQPASELDRLDSISIQRIKIGDQMNRNAGGSGQ